MPSESRQIAFLSDFGLGNEWVGICHAVMTDIAPRSPIVDLSHLVRALHVVSGALLLADCIPYTSRDAVALAVVDPNVGKDREIAIQTKSGRTLVGPDNGLLVLAADAAGGVASMVEIASPDIIRQPITPSFRARDTLCPAAAHLATGVPIERLGPPVDAETLARLDVPEAETAPGKIRCEVIDYNRFGNIQLNVREGHLAEAGLDRNEAIEVAAVSATAQARRGDTYADFDAGQYGVIVDPRGWLMIVRGNPGSALEGLGLDIGDPVWLSVPHTS
jgi:S-adenosyl-L-methionine hydrolase (adenosine-forming)